MCNQKLLDSKKRIKVTIILKLIFQKKRQKVTEQTFIQCCNLKNFQGVFINKQSQKVKKSFNENKQSIILEQLPNNYLIPKFFITYLIFSHHILDLIYHQNLFEDIFETIKETQISFKYRFQSY
ncbi:hypothetical protein TTHERM_000494749 (macronuclear) [Tetrahymena thermophila SB210]|uniref:Uncharacterized protein n=1 Tax=Tetrahymena thermophila (strain SB210) TaxID=312017 RepID=W7X4Q6_TETTS|nr:hypothetical protein TTHERM_000494749 [Tetrahymena thermophila SB210]EWS72397.1 hypothetical protein TTHERM_000494749 [Tetrahymena thermophila SB210]|eukprot:XP_012655081.1 hypothetical protein TTHERM_000494749 [Tetrahymena thermophila SB210]